MQGQPVVAHPERGVQREQLAPLDRAPVDPDRARGADRDEEPRRSPGGGGRIAPAARAGSAICTSHEGERPIRAVEPDSSTTRIGPESDAWI